MTWARLLAKLVLFTAVCAWILGLVTVGVALSPGFIDALETFGMGQGVVGTFLLTWYWITLVLVGIFTADKGFRFIGRWESDDTGE